jgi:NADPH:quinone reductase-like Zn-dependent oxidoreductase
MILFIICLFFQSLLHTDKFILFTTTHLIPTSKKMQKETKKILVIGATGQIGSELTIELRRKYGADNVIACGRKTQPSEKLLQSGIFEFADINNRKQLT